MFAKRKEASLRCSFCGKAQRAVKKLIAGPAVYICNECIDICNEILADDALIEPAAQMATQSSSVGSFMCPQCCTTYALHPLEPDSLKP